MVSRINTRPKEVNHYEKCHSMVDRICVGAVLGRSGSVGTAVGVSTDHDAKNLG